MALSPKERENIAEEETLRYETRRNLHRQYCARRRPIWPWILLAVVAAWLCLRHRYCRPYHCTYSGGQWEQGGYHSWNQENKDKVAPGEQKESKKP